MGKWLSRVIEKDKSERENYQVILGNITDKTDDQERPQPIHCPLGHVFPGTPLEGLL